MLLDRVTGMTKLSGIVLGTILETHNVTALCNFILVVD
jgi:hypothetical protein